MNIIKEAPTSSAAEAASLALRNLSVNDENKVTILEAAGIQTALQLLATFEPEAFEDANSRQSSPKRSGGDYLEEEYSFDSDVEEPGRSEDAEGLLPHSNLSPRVRAAILERAQFITRGSRCINLKNSAFLGGSGTLHVRLLQCKSLPRMDVGSLTDCFCQLSVGERHQTSKVVEDSLDPIFEEDFTFDIINCANQKLSLRAMDFDDIDEEEEEIRISRLDGKGDEQKNPTDKAGSIHDFIGTLQVMRRTRTRPTAAILSPPPVSRKVDDPLLFPSDRSQDPPGQERLYPRRLASSGRRDGESSEGAEQHLYPPLLIAPPPSP